MSALDKAAKAAHEAWYEEKRCRIMDLNPYSSVTPSWISERGEEQLVPWDFLSEDVREFDRIVVRAMVPVILDLLRSDECYYEVANAKQSAATAITEAANWAEKKLLDE